MLCYLDKTFCISPNCENKCGRKLTEEIIADANKWWGKPSGAPIAMSSFCQDMSDEEIFKYIKYLLGENT
jgi:hypothetical protein